MHVPARMQDRGNCRGHDHSAGSVRVSAGLAAARAESALQSVARHNPRHPRIAPQRPAAPRRPSGSLRPPDRFASDSPVGPSSPAGRSASRLSRFRRSAKPRRRGGGGRQKSVPDFPGMASLPPLPVLRGRIEVGVLRRWLCQVEAATNAAAVNPHPTLPLGTGRGNKRWSRMDLRSPGNSGTPRQNASGRT